MADAGAIEHRIGAGCHPDRAIGELADRQHGVVARRQLLACGIGRRAIARRLESTRLRPLHLGVYAVGHTRLTKHGRYMAAVLACGAGAVLSHRSAADLRGIRRTSQSRIAVTVPRAQRARRGIRLHRAKLAPDELELLDGIPATTTARTLLDLAAVLDRPALERAVAEAEARRLADLAGVHELLVGAGIVRPQLNAPIALADGEWVEADCVWRAERLVVELDGFEHHGTRRAFERDRARDRALQADGWRTARVTWRQLERDPGRVARDLRRLLGR